MGNKDRILAHNHIVSNVNQIIGLHTPLDPGLPKGGSVDGVTSADLHIIIDLNNTDLGNLVVLIAIRRKAKAIAADHGTSLDQNPASDSAAFQDGYVGMHGDIISHLHAVTNHNAGVQGHTVTQSHVITNKYTRIYGDGFTAPKVLAHPSLVADTSHGLENAME